MLRLLLEYHPPISLQVSPSESSCWIWPSSSKTTSEQECPSKLFGKHDQYQEKTYCTCYVFEKHPYMSMAASPVWKVVVGEVRMIPERNWPWPSALTV